MEGAPGKGRPGLIERGLLDWLGATPTLCWRGEGERSDKSVPAMGSTLASLLRLESGKFVPFVALRGLG